MVDIDIHTLPFSHNHTRVPFVVGESSGQGHAQGGDGPTSPDVDQIEEFDDGSVWVLDRSNFSVKIWSWRLKAERWSYSPFWPLWKLIKESDQVVTESGVEEIGDRILLNEA